MEKNMRGGGDAMIMMKMIMVVLICGISVWLVIMTMMIPCVDANHNKRPDMYAVGDYADGWKPENQFEIWTSNHQFYVGDLLFFGYDKTRYNVLVVNQTDFNNCSSVHPIENISGGTGQDLFNLSSAQTYYFMSGRGGTSGRGGCIKVAVTVQAVSEAPKEPQCPTRTETPKPTPSPPKNVSPSDSGRRNVVSTFIGTIAVACTLVWVVVWI